ncbi:MAG: glutamine-hydrolyzing GMP synthase subunit GuaA [Candidatus Omnitrophica bacterium]|nr:glutamine-hydrolyzing GMP synthase subunit GuaA [Candidatus Omnitrophota bacterium]
MKKFNARNFVKEKIVEIKKEVGSGKALCALSGGVDSTVAAVLAHQVLGNRLLSLFIDDGLMRENEAKDVTTIFNARGIRTEVLSAQNNFFKALKDIEDPEEKRKAFRNIFYRTLGSAVKRERADYLIQGTIAADISETKKGIKTQHNVLGQIGLSPKKYGLKIIEPLRTLYKDQVREVARSLGLPKKLSERMPFPGPGLATRVIGEVTPERVKMVRKATKIVEDEIKKLKPFQTFAVLLRDKATGIAKGKRHFGNIIVIRSVESKDAITAKVTKVPWRILEKIEKRIIKEIPSVVKVLYDLTPKPPSTIEYI